jgi:hypothetical protein
MRGTRGGGKFFRRTTGAPPLRGILFAPWLRDRASLEHNRAINTIKRCMAGIRSRKTGSDGN